MRHYNEIELWKNVTEEEWNDWKWQVRNRVTDVETLKQVIEDLEIVVSKLKQIQKQKEMEEFSK